MTLIIAHRGSSGNLPENTLEAFELAINQQADCIELDIVVSKDKHLIVRHDVFLSRSTNISEIEKFRNKKTLKYIDGVLTEDWFIADFTLEELKELNCIQPYLDPPQEFNSLFKIPTLNEVIEFLKKVNSSNTNNIGLFIEIKNSTFHSNLNLPLEELLIDLLKKENLCALDSFVKIMSFEVNNLKYLRKHLNNEIFQLFEEFDHKTELFLMPYDISLQQNSFSYKEMFTEKGLAEIKEYANGICLWKGYLLDKTFNFNSNNDNLFKVLKDLDFKVFIWTLSNKLILENSTTIQEEYTKFFISGVTGVITDFPEIVNQIK